MNITHHKNGDIKTLVEEAPYHPGYEDAGFKPNPVKELTDEEIDNLIMDVAEKPTNEDLYDFAIAILKKVQNK